MLEVIGLPVASFGLIGSVWPSWKRPPCGAPFGHRLFSASQFLFLVFLFCWTGRIGDGAPFWGILPAIFLYFSMQMTAYFTSHYLNQAAPSRMRATLLSFRSLATNVAYGVVACLYALLIWQLKNAQQPFECKVANTRIQQQAVFGS